MFRIFQKNVTRNRSEPVLNIPITPVVYGCEVDEYLQQGQAVAIAGFGDNNTGGQSAGRKRWASTKIWGSSYGMILVGETGISAWQGDSGGPAYVQFDDGSWHAFGIVSGGSQPSSPVGYVRMETVVPWVEQNSGVDITPCHDADGTWNPSASCGGFATSPISTGKNWSNWCSGEELSPESQTCGASFAPDEVAPVVSIVSPSNETVFEIDPSAISIEVAAEDDRAGIKRVWLEVDGQVISEKTSAPWVFEGTFPKGAYVLTAGAEDKQGNIAKSSDILLYIATDPGCGCSQGRPLSPGALLPFLMALFFAFRPRRRRS